MPHICYDENEFFFPATEEADEDGLLLMGGKVTPARVLEGYAKGIFPWYHEDTLPLWWSPDPRFILFPDDLHISRSMHKLLLKNTFEFRINTDFEGVIEACATAERAGQNGTWITKGMKNVYTRLYHDGYAHSAEAWLNGKMAGGMYGLQLGRVFFGESMFSKATNASKFAFIKFVRHLKQNGIRLVDCQVYTRHVESLGAREIDRNKFLFLLQTLTG